MNRRYWIAVSCSLFAAGVVTATAPDASACIGPSELYEVDATLPADGAENVGLSPSLAVQLDLERGYPDGRLFEQVFDGELLQLSIVGPDGVEVMTAEVDLTRPFDGASERGLVSAPVDGLAPDTTYTAELRQRDALHQWTFTTGDGEVEPFATPDGFEINLDAYFADVPVTKCCPIDQVGQCPTCFTVGDEPVPTINAGFEVLPHPEGAGAFVYTLQRRENVDNARWEDVASGAFGEFGLGTLSQTSDRLDNADTCIRVTARSVVEPLLDYESNEICLDGQEHFSDPPQYDLDHSRVMCGDDGEDPDDTDPPDDGDGDDDDAGDEELTGGDDPDDGESADEQVGEDPGWEFSEGGDPKITDEGCGCATADRRAMPAELLLLLGLLGIRRRK